MMEVVLALIIFVALIATWFVLPGTVTTIAAPELETWTTSDALQVAPAVTSQ